MVENWLNENIPGYQELLKDEKEALHHFTMLWSFFENYVLDGSANASKILEKMESWRQKGRLNKFLFQVHLKYFQERYVQEGTTNEKFEALKFRGNDRKDLGACRIMTHFGGMKHDQ